MATHREKIQSTMSTKRPFQSRLTNNTKVWASGPHLASGICAQKLREGRAPQRQITHKKGIHRINYHTVSRIKPNRLLMKSILAYNISDGDKKILFDLDSDTFTKLSTNRIDRHNETHTEVLSQYILLLNTRHISKPYSQQILDLTTLKSLRIKLFIWEYLGEKVRQQAWEKESAETSHTHTNKTNHNMLQHTFRGVEPHPPNYANSTTDADTRIKNVLSTNHVAECKETSKAPSRNSYSNQTHFPSTILDYIDTHTLILKWTPPLKHKKLTRSIRTHRTLDSPTQTSISTGNRPSLREKIIATQHMNSQIYHKQFGSIQISPFSHQHTRRGVRLNPHNSVNTTTDDGCSRINKTLIDQSQCKEISNAPSRKNPSQTHFPSTILAYIDMHTLILKWTPFHMHKKLTRTIRTHRTLDNLKQRPTRRWKESTWACNMTLIGIQEETKTKLTSQCQQSMAQPIYTNVSTQRTNSLSGSPYSDLKHGNSIKLLTKPMGTTPKDSQNNPTLRKHQHLISKLILARFPSGQPYRTVPQNLRRDVAQRKTFCRKWAESIGQNNETA